MLAIIIVLVVAKLAVVKISSCLRLSNPALNECSVLWNSTVSSLDLNSLPAAIVSSTSEEILFETQRISSQSCSPPPQTHTNIMEHHQMTPPPTPSDAWVLPGLRDPKSAFLCASIRLRVFLALHSFFSPPVRTWPPRSSIRPGSLPPPARRARPLTGLGAGDPVSPEAPRRS